MVDEKNIVSQPPLTTPIIDQGGNPSKAWAIWFRDIYNRVSYKGGNAIDDNSDLIEGTIDTLEEAILQILQNVSDIADNADAIEQNAEDIQQNAEDIATNAQNTLYLEHRALGQDRPQPYQESGASYAVGDLVVYPVDDPQKYYSARESVADPAGVFDPSKWNEKSIKENLSIVAALEVLPVKAVHFAFTGTAVNGAVTPAYSFNLSSLTRSGVGVYDGVITQQTFYGFNVLDNANPAISYSIQVTAATEAFHIEYTKTSATTFTIEVFEWIQGIGNKIDLAPYDPDTAGDLVYVTMLADLSDGQLPPP
tara:strand:+ start:2750 stop:3676 length:927 start_codon:yes stop_codon:yes gene_type:complete